MAFQGKECVKKAELHNSFTQLCTQLCRYLSRSKPVIKHIKKRLLSVSSLGDKNSKMNEKKQIYLNLIE